VLRIKKYFLSIINIMKSVITFFSLIFSVAFGQSLKPVLLKTEYLDKPMCVDNATPRLYWQVAAVDAAQTAYQILASSSAENLEREKADLWDSGKITSSETAHIVWQGKQLSSGQACYWKVKVWDQDEKESNWSSLAEFGVGMLTMEDWKAEWISFKDETPLHQDEVSLYLPPAHHYRKSFLNQKSVKRAILYGAALGLIEWNINGEKVGGAYFEPGWSDYRKRVYYRAHDVTKMMKSGHNAIGAIVADGWYAGYLGFGKLMKTGPYKTGRSMYGKTPALMGQLLIEYSDGSKESVATDNTWQTSSDGPIREADIIMGEFFDAQKDFKQWCMSDSEGKLHNGNWNWLPVVRAEENGSIKAKFYDTSGEREVELGFIKPKIYSAYTAPDIKITEEIKAKKMTEPKPGVYIFDVGENMAGFVQLKVKGSAGTKITIRHGEMLNKDGSLMTENLRSARATDFYILKGDNTEEVWHPRFTYHGFQYVEITGLEEKPTLEAVTGLVVHNDTVITGQFSCSDPVMTQFWKNSMRTQKSNFFEVPTDCPQRDERMGWMGDAQIYVRTATFNADVASFFTKWMNEVTEDQTASGYYTGYSPYEPQICIPGAAHGAAWSDAGVICPWTIWKVYGDKKIVRKNWDSMVKFMDWRFKSDPNLNGVNIGHGWGDWLNINEDTPVQYVDACYHAYVCNCMAQMAMSIDEKEAATLYFERFAVLKKNFNINFMYPVQLDESNKDAIPLTPKVNTQTACALALWANLLEGDSIKATADRLADKVRANDTKMATGFLGTKIILPVLSAHGHHDIASELFVSRKFPSWGYEVEQGATSVWERWDSYTKEHGFQGLSGKNNAEMNSFSHYSFGAVMEWGFSDLAGIDTDGTGYQKIIINPRIPTNNEKLNWVKASYNSPQGMIESSWKKKGEKTTLHFVIPPNTTATVGDKEYGSGTYDVDWK
jgi:alpha-L-rhamnosidase